MRRGAARRIIAGAAAARKGASAEGSVLNARKNGQKSSPAWQQPEFAAQLEFSVKSEFSVVASASSIMRRIVLAHLPHWGLQPRQPYTWPAVRGAMALPASVPRTSRSLSTLQEQTIIAARSGLVSIATIAI